MTPNEPSRGCCHPGASATPGATSNRPGLPAIRYRVGTFSSFRGTMLEAASAPGPLREWTARAGDDFAVALLEMWAYLADILTFYQERAANEAFLRTATQRASVLRLAALLDYRPAPGSSAVAYLAFTAERGKTVRVSEGLRVQSVPGQDERPQKFQTDEPVVANARLNAVRITAPPTAINPFAAGEAELTLDPAQVVPQSDGLATGANVVIFSTPGSQGVEEKRVASLRIEAGRTLVRWSTPMQKDWPADARAFQFRRKFRLFGFDVPARFTALRRSTVTISGTELTSLLPETATRDGSNYAASVASLGLAGVVDDLKPGTRLVVTDGTQAYVLTVSGTTQVAAVLGPTPAGTDLFWEPPSGAATRVNPVETFTTESVDARNAVVYELAGPSVQPWPFVVAPVVAGQTVAARPEDLAPSDLPLGRTVFVVDGTGKVVRARVTGINVDGASGQTLVTLSEALTGVDSASALLLGNVARASHGEPVSGEVLGSGDASASFQTFTLKKTPVSHVPAIDDPGQIRSALRLRVNGVRWAPARSLYDRDATEQVYEERLDETGRTVVRFGDSAHGPRAPTGRNNLVADYRVGIGRDGNVGAGTLTTPLDRPTGLKAVTNPEKALGGSDPETIDQAREAAPRTVRTFDRIVSLRDFEDAALDHPVVAKARAGVVWDGEEQAVSLTVAGEDGQIIVGTARDELLAYLDARRDPYRKLDLVTHTPVPLVVELIVQVDPDRDEDSVIVAVRQAVLDAFAFRNRTFGQSVFLSGVYQVIQQVAGVEAALATRLQYREPAARVAHGAAADPVLVRLQILAHELAVLAPDDLTVVAGRIDPQAATT